METLKDALRTWKHMTLVVRVRPTGWEQIPEETVQIKILRIPKKYLKFVEF